MDCVVFLDVDGVLHSLYGDDIFQERCCAELERLLRATGAAVVLSSSWRRERAQVAMLNEMLAQRGLPPVIDCTEVLDTPGGRAEEICRWLDRHPEVARWVAIDDLDLEVPVTSFAVRMRGHFVRTVSEVGLTPALADAALRVLLPHHAQHRPAPAAAAACGGARPADISSTAARSPTPPPPRVLRAGGPPGSAPPCGAPEAMAAVAPAPRPPPPRGAWVENQLPVGFNRTVTTGIRQDVEEVSTPSFRRQVKCQLQEPTEAGVAAFRKLAEALGRHSDEAAVLLHCVLAEGVDLAAIAPEDKCVVLKRDGGPWTLGRLTHPEIFARLVPDEAIRSCISRSHLELVWEYDSLRVRKLSPNPVMLNGMSVAEATVPPGSHLAFCGLNLKTPCLAFMVLISEAMEGAPKRPGFTTAAIPPGDELERAAPAPARVGRLSNWSAELPNAPAVAAGGPVADYTLECVHLQGVNLPALPADRRKIALQLGDGIVVGRSHQTAFFEGILGGHPLFARVSRSHLELSPMRGKAAAVELRNISANPVSIPTSGLVLQEGDRTVVELPVDIGFLLFISGRPDPEVFLQLRFGLQLRLNAGIAGQAAAPVPPELPSTQRPSRDAQVSSSLRALPGTSYAPPAAPEPPGAADPRGNGGSVTPRAQAPALPPRLGGSGGAAPGGAAEGQIRGPARRAPSPAPPAATAAPRSFCLELGGTAVREELSPDRRRIVCSFSDSGVTVGRAHQRALHESALQEGAAQWVSRDHFRVDLEAGTPHLHLLSSNPLWYVHQGHRVELRRGHIPVPLNHGDLLLLFSGAHDGTPDGPGSVGTLHWVFFHADFAS